MQLTNETSEFTTTISASASESGQISSSTVSTGEETDLGDSSTSAGSSPLISGLVAAAPELVTTLKATKTDPSTLSFFKGQMQPKVVDSEQFFVANKAASASNFNNHIEPVEIGLNSYWQSGIDLSVEPLKTIDISKLATTVLNEFSAIWNSFSVGNLLNQGISLTDQLAQDYPYVAIPLIAYPLLKAVVSGALVAKTLVREGLTIYNVHNAHRARMGRERLVTGVLEAWPGKGNRAAFVASKVVQALIRQLIIFKGEQGQDRPQLVFKDPNGNNVYLSDLIKDLGGDLNSPIRKALYRAILEAFEKSTLT